VVVADRILSYDRPMKSAGIRCVPDDELVERVLAVVPLAQSMGPVV